MADPKVTHSLMILRNGKAYIVCSRIYDKILRPPIHLTIKAKDVTCKECLEWLHA